MFQSVLQKFSDNIGLRLRVSSHYRQGTNTHDCGDAVDVVPVIMENYAGANNSDPILSYRDDLITLIDTCARDLPYGGIILIENDHLHFMIGIPETSGHSPWTVTVQRDRYPKYLDTNQRAEHALFSREPWTSCKAGASIKTEHSPHGELMRFAITGTPFRG